MEAAHSFPASPCPPPQKCGQLMFLNHINAITFQSWTLQCENMPLPQARLCHLGKNGPTSGSQVSMGPRFAPNPSDWFKDGTWLTPAQWVPHPGLTVGGWRGSCCFYRLADLVVEHHVEEPGCWSLDLNWNPIFIIGHVTFLKFPYISKNWLPWGFPLAQMVKNLPAMQETQVQSLGWEDSL